MELRQEFSVPVPVEEAWRALLDIEGVAPCMPGAAVESFDGETIRGSVRVKVGPIALTYRGTAVFEERDEDARWVVLSADGRDARGLGTARARVTGVLAEGEKGGTVVSVTTDLTVTGRPAQFGRGVLADVGDRIVAQFAENLAARLAAAGPEAAAAEAAEVEAGGEPEPAGGPVAPADLDLLRTAGVPVAKRVGVVVGVAAAVLLVFRWWRGRG